VIHQVLSCYSNVTMCSCISWSIK